MFGFLKKSKKEVRFHGITPIDSTRDEDVFIVGYPKSGNTWMQYIIAHMVYHLNETSSKVLVNAIVPDRHSNSHYLRLNSRCFFKTHSLPNERFKKVIYILRDGRDAMYSYFRMKYNMNQKVNIENFFSADYKKFPSSWQEHIKAWFDNPFNAEILYIKYEDLLRNNLDTLKKIAEFIGMSDLGVERLQYVGKMTRFDQLRSHEERDPNWQKRKNDKNFKKGSYFFRKGQIGDYKNEVPEGVISDFESYSKDALRLAGYELTKSDQN